MSYFCQFCDKEMLFEASVVETLDKYITCGAAKCVSQAGKTALAIYNEKINKQGAFVSAKVLIFSTRTPTDNSTWRLVPIDSHPSYMKDPGIMAEMLDGAITSKKTTDNEPEIFYSAKRETDVTAEVANSETDAIN